MRIYTQSRTGATERRNFFARQAALDAFGPKAAQHLNGNNFTDRRSDQRPKRLGEVVDQMVGAVAHRAVRHWLREAARAATESEREEALSIAAKIAKAAGFEWPDEEAA